jgi:phage portal protein BeeE
MLRPDLDLVPALSAERDALWARLEAATFLTDPERRRMAGLGDDLSEVSDE